jgi:hypothetical protein
MTKLRSTRALQMRYTMRLAPLAALAVIGVAHVAVAAPRCEKSCKAETTGCIADRCAGLGGQARRECIEICRGIGGCARIRTLAYVVSKCTVGGFHQKLQIRRRDCDPVTVLDFPEPSERPLNCAPIGLPRFGYVSSPIVGAFQRIGVSPDGRHVVFEVTDDFSGTRQKLVPPEQPEGIFIVRADGRGLRRLGPASRDPSFRYAMDPASPLGLRVGAWIPFPFSPDGRAVVLTDLGTCPAGEEAVQIFTLDVVTGERKQLTHLPVVADRPEGAIGLSQGTRAPVFRPDGRISFQSFGNLDGSNPDGSLVQFVMNRDGSDLKRVPLPVPVPGSHVVESFGVTSGGVHRTALALSIPGTPVNPAAGTRDTIAEVFFVDRKNVTQLTDFRRVDTAQPNLDGRRVIFAASANPPSGTNPSGTCQLFSIGTDGAALRQLTQFSQPEYSVNGCNALVPPGCSILPLGLDPATGILVFFSSCDPFGANPYGDQMFAIRADGTQLRQLTHARGLVSEPDGTVSSENIGPAGSSSFLGGQ